VGLTQTGVGSAHLGLEGPEVMTVRMHDAIRARAEAMGRLPGDQRTLDQRMFDAAYEMLLVDADGGPSTVPTLTDLDGELVTVGVRGVQVAVVTPYSVTQGGNAELAEIPGLGPILPSAARELLAQAEVVQRVAVDAGTGEVLAVDDPVRTHREDAVPETTADVGVSGSQVMLRELAGQPVVWRDLSSSSYRTPGRLRRFIEQRDRTCCFPGCTVPGRYCDVDHREEWPRGGTHQDNCHVLCRRHHRAKQFYFALLTLDPATGDSCWTTHEGATYRRPPPRW
jgi:hypothetical protein